MIWGASVVIYIVITENSNNITPSRHREGEGIVVINRALLEEFLFSKIRFWKVSKIEMN